MKKIDLNKVITIIDYALFFVSASLLCCIIVIVMQTILGDGWIIKFSIDGIKGMQQFWSEYKPIITTFGFTLTLFIANHNLSKYLDIETANALSKLRKLLNTDEKKKIHYYLLDKDDKKLIIPEIDKKEDDACCKFSNVELFDYLGTIELGIIMRERGIISKKEFESQFGYRVENLWKNEAIVKHIMKHKKYYEYFLKSIK